MDSVRTYFATQHASEAIGSHIRTFFAIFSDCEIATPDLVHQPWYPVTHPNF